MEKNKIVHLIWPPLLIYIAYLISKFAWIDNIASLANDSVHYLVMARHYSPWFGESPSIAAAWPYQDFPLLFPWLLALTGAAHSFLYAHILVFVMGLMCIYLYYLLSSRWMGKEIWIIFPISIFALSPGFILGLQGILSESFYLFLVLAFMLYYKPTENISTRYILVAGFLLAAVLLTRTIGISLCLAILAQAFFSSDSQKRVNYLPVIIVAIALVIYLFLMEIWGPVKESHYLDMLIPYLTGKDLYQIGTGTGHYFSVASQLTSLFNSWTTFWVIYWQADVFSSSYYVVTALLLLSMTGLLIRLFKNKYDAWYVLFYLFILLVWPHPGQMVRLLFPIMPLMLLYAGYTITILVCLAKIPDRKIMLSSIFYIFVLITVLPSHAFIHARASMASGNQMTPVYEIFRKAGVEAAFKDLVLQNQILKDFSKIKEYVPEDAKILYFLPSYLAVLSDRKGVAAPSPVDGRTYRQIAKENSASYIFLTRFHPRNTHPDFSGLTGAEHLRSGTEIVWCSQLANGELASCLYKITKP